jgi:predicted nuclease of predicted toxin-antitoxin system
VDLLADENIHADVVAWLRTEGHDVLYAAESLSGSSDYELLRVAQEQARILITDDKDFGELVFFRRMVSNGVVLIRLSSSSIAVRLTRLAEAWPGIEAQARGTNRFVVIGDRAVRIRALPAE